LVCTNVSIFTDAAWSGFVRPTPHVGFTSTDRHLYLLPSKRANASDPASTSVERVNLIFFLVVLFRFVVGGIEESPRALAFGWFWLSIARTGIAWVVGVTVGAAHQTTSA
jgi:hypothetical protein